MVPTQSNSSQGTTGAGDPQNDFNNAVDQWNQNLFQYSQARMELEEILSKIEALVKEHKTGAAFQLIKNQVMPGVMEVQGTGQMASLSASMNISSALQEFTARIQKDMNDMAGSDPAKAQAASEDFVKQLRQLYGDVNVTPPPPYLQHIQGGLLDAITKICNVFRVNGGAPATDPNQLSPHLVLTDITQWVTYPTDPAYYFLPNGSTGQQVFQDLQSGFTRLNNTESAQSQGLQAQLQFAASQFTQFMNIAKSILEASQKQSQALVQNQKSQ